MKRYARGGRGGGISGGEIRETAYLRFCENLEVCRDLFHGYDYATRLDGSPLDQGRNVTQALNWLLPPDRKDEQKAFLDHGLRMHRALQLCMSVVSADERKEAAFFDAVRVQLVRVQTGGETGKRSLREVNAQVAELIRQSVSADGVLNVFTDKDEAVPVLSPEFLCKLEAMHERNLAVEMLKSLLKTQLRTYRKTDLVKTAKYADLMHASLNKYVNGHINNEKVIQELLDLARQIMGDKAELEKLGLDAEEAAFYSALTKPKAVKDFYTNENLRELTKVLTETLRQNRTIDWQLKDSARARMRLLVKQLLKKYKYPPDDAQEALDGVLNQCELWADNCEW